jgi:nucleoside-diphosphate kinase
MVWEAEGIIETVRKMMGNTFGYDAQPGTIRGDFSCSRGYNLIHGSDSRKSAEQEIEIFFRPDEIIEYELADANWLYGKND